MSRCFRFPPPGFTVSREKQEAWFEEIKLYVVKLREKLERREKMEKMKEKRKKMEKMKEKRKKMSKGKEDETNNKSSHVSDPCLEINVLDTEDDLVQTRGESDTQQLEGSCLTQDHGVYISSPDSTGNSHKRKRSSETENDGSGNGEGQKKICSMPKPIRSSNQGFHPIIDQDKSISGEIEAVAPRETVMLPLQEVASQDGIGTGEALKMLCSTVKATRSSDQGFRRITNQKKKQLISGKIQAIAPPETVMLPVQEAVHYNQVMNSIQPWFQEVPLPPSNLDWLFKCGTNYQKRHLVESATTNCCRSSSMWPCADFLPEINGFVLPYTIPF